MSILYTIDILFYNMSTRNLFSLSIRPSEIPVSAAHASEIPGWRHYLPGFLQALTCIPARQQGSALASAIAHKHKQTFLPLPPQKVRNCTGIQFLVQGVAIYDSVLGGFGLQSSGKMSTDNILVWRSSQTGATAKKK